MNDIATIKWLSAHTGMSIVLGLLFFYAIFLLWRWNASRTNKIEISDLVCLNGRIDEKKFTRFGAWVVSTWGFVYLILDDKFSEWFFAGYMAAWVSNALFDKFLNRNKAKEVESINVTEDFTETTRSYQKSK